MIREVVLRDFPNWSAEKQLAEFQAYKKLGSFSPFTDADYELMEMVINNPNAEVSVQCEGGVCSIIVDDEQSLEIDEILSEKYEMSTKTNAATISILRTIYKDIKSIKDVHSEMRTLKLVLNNIYRMSMTSNDVYAAASEKSLGLILDILRSKFIGKRPLYLNKTDLDGKGNDRNSLIDKLHIVLEPEEFGLVFKHVDDKYIRLFFDNILKIDHKNLLPEYQTFANTLMTISDVMLTTKIKNISVIQRSQIDDVGTVKEIVVSSDFVNKFREHLEIATQRRDVDINKSKFLLNYLETNFDKLTPAILSHFNSLEMSEENIKSFNSEKYSDPFFADMFKYEEVRQFGKGEILLEYLFDGAKINGASESFDLTVTKGGLLGKNQLEVKVYDAPRDIAIGTTGKISRYPIFSDITRLLKQLLNILNDDDLVRGIKSNMVKYSDVITDDFTIAALTELHHRLEQASVPSKFFEYFDEISPKIKSVFSTLIEHKLNSSNTIRIEDKFVTFNDISNITVGKQLEVVDVSTEDKDNTQLREVIKSVLAHPYMKDNNHMLGQGGKLEDAVNEINSKFSETPMILIVKSGSSFYVHGIHTEFEFTRVSLGEIKISPKSS